MADHGANIFTQLVLKTNPISGRAFCAEYLNGSNELINNTILSIHPPAWQIWTVGLTMVTIISFSSALGIVLMPFLSPAFYERTLTYFVALGIGTLSGSAIFNLIPETDGKRTRRLSCESRKSHVASVAWLVIFGDGLHNFIDGLSIGASFNNSLLEGLSVSIAILCEELPHELGDCAILVSSGMSLKKALVYNLLSAFTCYVGFIIGILVGNISPEFGPFVFAVAGGMFLYIALAGMLSEINDKAENLIKTDLKLGISTTLLQSAGLASGLLIIYLLTRFGSIIQL